jgi:hypothetical protein
MSNIIFNMNKNVRKPVTISQLQVPKLLNTVEEKSSSNHVPCIACPGSYINVNLNEEQKDNKYTNILDTNLILKNKYSKNYVNLDNNVDNIRNSIQTIVQNHFKK